MNVLKMDMYRSGLVIDYMKSLLEGIEMKRKRRKEEKMKRKGRLVTNFLASLSKVRSQVSDCDSNRLHHEILCLRG